MDTIGEQLRTIRERLDVSQAEVAEHLGVDPSHVSNVERDRKGMPLSKVERWAERLGMKLVVVPLDVAAPEEIATLPDELREAILQLVRVAPLMSKEARDVIEDQLRATAKRYSGTPAATSHESLAKTS